MLISHQLKSNKVRKSKLLLVLLASVLVFSSFSQKDVTAVNYSEETVEESSWPKEWEIFWVIIGIPVPHIHTQSCGRGCPFVK